MTNLHFEELPSGFHFYHSNQMKTLPSDFVIVSPQVKETDVELNFDLFIDNESTNPRNLKQLSSKFSIYHLTGEIGLPADGFNFNFFSYDSKSHSSQRVYEQINLISDYNNISREDRLEFQKIPRAVLHLFPSKYWIIEDFNENVYCSMLSVKINDTLLLFSFSVLPSMKEGTILAELIKEVVFREKFENVFLYDQSECISMKIKETLPLELVNTYSLYASNS